MVARRARAARYVSTSMAGALLAGLLSTLSILSPQEAGAASDPTPVVPSQSLGSVPAQQPEEVGKALPAPDWPQAAEATVDLSNAAPGDPGSVTPSLSPSATNGDADPSQIGDVVEVAPAPDVKDTSTQLGEFRRVGEDTTSPSPSSSSPALLPTDASPAPEVKDGETPQPSASATSEPPSEGISPGQVDVRVLDRAAVAPVGGIGLGLQVTRSDGGESSGQVQVAIDYSGFKYAYGADFASRLLLVKFPACALDTPEAEGCTDREFVPVDNDQAKGLLTATVTADPGQEGVSTQLAGSAATVYTLASGSSSDQGDYRASTLSSTGSWDVSTGSGAFNYSLPIQLPKPPMGSAPSLQMSYNSQSVDGRTSATNNQASWSGMGWDLNVGFIERRYRNCTQDGLSTIGDLCWDSPNSSKEPSGAVYVINLDGVSSELVQDNTGTGSYHIKDDPGWRVQRLFNGHGAGRDGEYWVISSQDGHRYYLGWGRSERTGTATASVFTVPVVGNDAGEPCHDQFPDPCTQAWRWNLDRVVDVNEVETMYFYDKEYNHYRSVAGTDQARSYVSSGYVKEIQYGWSSQIADAKVPAKVELSHVNRCIERVQENDPLRDEPATCPTFDAKPGSYPDVPVDLMCDGTSADYDCAGKTYYPTFFSTDMLWDIKTYVSDQDGSGWDLVEQYQNKYGMPNPDGTIGKTLWLDYVQRKTYGDGADLVLPVINFNRVDLDNKVGSSELNFPRIQEIHDDLGATTTVSYGFANPCTTDNLPSQSSNTQDCYWQKWTPEGSTDSKTGWFKKFLVTKVVVDPTVTTNQDGAPLMTTSYTYEDGAAWRFTNDPLTKDEDETWSDWRGYQEVEISAGADTGRRTTKHWLYRGLSGDRTSKTDPSATKTVTVNDGDGNNYTDHAWLAGKTLSTSLRDDKDISHQRTYHTYWDHVTAQYDGLPDARFVRDAKTTTNTKISTGWRESVSENEYDDSEKASTTFGLPMRTDEWGETGVSDNRCTTYGRAYNTDAYDSTGAQRWTVFTDQIKHYSVGCSSITDSNQDGYTTTLYDNSAAVADNHPVDGNPTEIRTYTKASDYCSQYFGYDDAGRKIWSEDKDHNRVTTTYNPKNTWPLSGITTTTVDPDGSLTAAGPLSSTVWLSRFWGVPTSTKDANGQVTRVTLDAAGRTAEVWKPTETGSSPSMKFSYAIPTSTNGSGVPDAVDGYPHITSDTLQSGTTYLTSHAYTDALGRPRETQTPLPRDIDPATHQLVPYRQVAVTRYDSIGQVTGTSAVFRNQGTAGSGGPSSPEPKDLPSYTDLVLDWAGRAVVSELEVFGNEQLAGRTATTYNGDYTSVQPAVGAPTDTYTDVYGQVSKVVEHDSSSAYTTQYGYSGKGQLASITDPRGNISTYGYDWAGQRTSVTDPDAGSSTTEYDKNGLVRKITSNGGQNVLNYNYDYLGRKVSLSSGSDQLASWTWDDPAVEGGEGHVTSTTSRDAEGNTYTTKIGKFDERGRPLSTTTTIPSNVTGLAGAYTTTFGYDAADHITTVSYPKAGGLDAETVTTTYDDYGRPYRLTGDLGNTVYIDGTTYDAYDRLVERNYGAEFGGNGIQAQRQYGYNDSNGTRWLSNIATTVTANDLIKEAQKDTYSYDNAGKITELREQANGQTAQSQCFRYDDLDRLTNAYTRAAAGVCAQQVTSDFAGSDPYQTSYSYDRLGNLQSVTNTDAAAKATKHDYLYPGYDDTGTWTTPNAATPHGVRKIDHITGGSTTATDTFTYYADGAMKQRIEPGITTDYTWTKLNQLATVKTTKKSGSDLTRYTYDAEGNLLVRTTPGETVAQIGGMELHTTDGIKVTATRYYSSGSTTAAMRTTTGNTVTNGKITYLMADNQASIQLAVDSTTGTAARRRYTPFGDERSGTLPAGTDHGFLGKTEDNSTGLSLLGARAYDPKLGRFLSPDPISAPYDPQNLSAYSYSHNDPVNFADPNGLADDRCTEGGVSCGGGRPKKNDEWDKYHGDSPTQGTIPTLQEEARDARMQIYDAVGDYATSNAQYEAWIAAFRAEMEEAYDRQKIVDANQTIGIAVNVCYNHKEIGCSQDLKNYFKDVEFARMVSYGLYENSGPEAALRGGLSNLGKALRSRPCNSFTPSTAVRMADGSEKKLEDVKVGDRVLATDPETGKTEARTVLSTILGKGTKHLVEITIDVDGQRGGKTASLTATKGHPFWAADLGQWIDATDLHKGSWLRTSAGTHIQITAIRRWTEHATVRNLTVDGIHTYYVLAGDEPILVHNAGGPTSPAKGNKGTQLLIGELEAKGYIIRGTEISATAANGVNVRFDVVAEKNGKLHLYDAKNGPNAGFTTNQNTKGGYASIEAGGGTWYGGNAHNAGLSGSFGASKVNIAGYGGYKFSCR
ncbi:polymorphic toxin-type HINT domain-containing protein [Streptomyces sp. NPDC002952]|uniref:polymorphic toxin-type HINT domain-containing protein n=1 Tax=Streptomyces sp. NPDC002952 TaxID=3364673 RepID=UPI003694B2FE